MAMSLKNNISTDLSNLSKKRILVTGGAGYIGSVLTPLLLKGGYFVKVVDALILNQKPPAIDPGFNSFEFIKGDLRNYKVLKSALKDIDIVVHLAALVGEPACRKNSNLCYEINKGLVEKLNDLRQDIPLIFTSTTSVYGEAGSKICFEDKTELKPILDYAKSKYEAEKIIKNKDNYIILRPAIAFGFSPRMRLDTLVNEFVFKAVKYKYLEIYNPAFVRTFIHVKDFAESILMMVEKFNKFRNQIFNVGNNNMNATKKKIADLIKSKINFEFKIVPGKADPDKRDFIVNYDKIEKIGFKTKISLENGIDEMIKKFKNLEDNPSFYNVNYKFA